MKTPPTAILAGGCFAALLALATPARAAVLAEYTFTGDSPSPTVEAPSTDSSNFAISSGTLQFGSVAGFTSPPYAQGSSGYNAADQSSAKYFYFDIDADAGFAFSVTNLSFLVRSTGAGPSAVGASINGVSIWTSNIAADTTLSVDIDLSAFNFGNLTTAQVRFEGWDNGSRVTTGGGQMRIDDVLLQGSVVPEPGTAAMVVLGSLGLYSFRRRLSAQAAPSRFS